MTKRIFRSIFSVSAIVLVISISLILGILYGHFGDQLESELKQEAQYLALAVEGKGTEVLEKLPKGGERVTLVSKDGTVLFDNQADKDTMENHLEREEIQEALKSGQGKARRTSSTIGKHTVYYALRLSDGNVIRVSSTQYSLGGLLGGMIQPVLLLIFIMLVLSLFVAFRVSKRIVEPLNHLDLENPKTNDVYDELSPLLSKIYKQQKTIQQQLGEAKRQQEEFSIITNNMSEGLVVMDKQTELLSSNNSALKLLGVKKASPEQSVLTLNRSEPFRRAVEDVLGGKHVVSNIELEDGIRQLIANPVYEDGKITGGVLLLVDVTEKMQREKLRREFTANVSHELKTPLTSISGYAEIMQDGYVKQEDVKRVAGKIYDEAQRLINLVGDIIEISRLDEGISIYKEERVDLYEVAGEMLNRLQEEAVKKEIQMELLGESLVFMTIRPILEEVIYNLCDNAIKYNRNQGKVTVRVFCTEKQFGFSVSDTGIGISMVHQDRIFERFYRVDKSRSKEIGGTGLGLSIVKHGAVCLGAKISLDSVPEEGSTFTVSWDAGR